MTHLVTEQRLRGDLAALGVRPGSTLMVHSSLSAIGWVLGGAPTVVRALLEVLGTESTLVMPAATPGCADPAAWADPGMPAAWLEEVRAHLPIFDPRTTPTSLGAIPETFRNWPDTRRSDHPLESVCARGVAAATVTAEHPLAFSEGRGGPFEKLYDLEAQVLLLGVGFDRCTALHFAESLARNRRVMTVRFPVLEGGERVWKEVPNVADDHGRHFPSVGREFIATGGAREGRVGGAASILCSMRSLVDLAVGYFERTL